MIRLLLLSAPLGLTTAGARTIQVPMSDPRIRLEFIAEQGSRLLDEIRLVREEQREQLASSQFARTGRRTNCRRRCANQRAA